MKKNMSDDNKKIIQNIIQKKIINSNDITINNHINNNIDDSINNNINNNINKKNNREINKSDNNKFTNKYNPINEYESCSNTNSDTEESTESDIDIDRNKFCDKNNRKYKNQNITKTSEKLLNRLTSEAQYINNIGGDITNISRPFSEEPGFIKSNQLGKRKHIKKI